MQSAWKNCLTYYRVDVDILNLKDAVSALEKFKLERLDKNTLTTIISTMFVFQLFLAQN